MPHGNIIMNQTIEVFKKRNVSFRLRYKIPLNVEGLRDIITRYKDEKKTPTNERLRYLDYLLTHFKYSPPELSIIRDEILLNLSRSAIENLNNEHFGADETT